MGTVAGAVIAIVAEVLILVSYAVPYANYEAGADYDAGSYSIFGVGALQTIGGVIAIACGVAAATLLVAMRHRIAVAVASGALMALGVRELADWVAVSGTSLEYGDHLAIGSVLGVMGSVALFSGGLIAFLSPAPSAGTGGHLPVDKEELTSNP
jgi:hypothetical protein